MSAAIRSVPRGWGEGRREGFGAPGAAIQEALAVYFHGMSVQAQEDVLRWHGPLRCLPPHPCGLGVVAATACRSQFRIGTR